MATNFPSSLDSFTNPVAGDSLASPSHAGQHADVNDAIEAIETKLGIGAHTIGEWTSFTPVFTNFTLGNGTVSAKYCQINDVVLVVGQAVFGSTSSLSGYVFVNHPVGACGSPIDVFNGVVRWTDTGTATYTGNCQMSSTYVRLGVNNVIALNAGVRYGATSSTFPFTFTTSDSFYWSYWYQKA